MRCKCTLPREIATLNELHLDCRIMDRGQDKPMENAVTSSLTFGNVEEYLAQQSGGKVHVFTSYIPERRRTWWVMFSSCFWLDPTEIVCGCISLSDCNSECHVRSQSEVCNLKANVDNALVCVKERHHSLLRNCTMIQVVFRSTKFVHWYYRIIDIWYTFDV